ncbi:hypothetical protein [Xanthomonas vesicatoria]|uniref:hypothetical protein n=1 Tax=Xanthomonas vesicatoria TaxID=56460 RepID=UPI0012D927A8|nr:hypothetical protein [Xanthomonas vesicatoria]MCC8679406.1 hypothetical protein [Xanthomonas vesicatoria]MCC8682518.1 hypothetical protein [Xanthomonas vesicatoria]
MTETLEEWLDQQYREDVLAQNQASGILVGVTGSNSKPMAVKNAIWHGSGSTGRLMKICVTMRVSCGVE